jgi:hypothetical protein
MRTPGKKSGDRMHAAAPFCFSPVCVFLNANASAALWRESKKSRPLLCVNELISIHFFLLTILRFLFALNERVAAVTLLFC